MRIPAAEIPAPSSDLRLSNPSFLLPHHLYFTFIFIIRTSRLPPKHSILAIRLIPRFD